MCVLIFLSLCFNFLLWYELNKKLNFPIPCHAKRKPTWRSRVGWLAKLTWYDVTWKTLYQSKYIYFPYRCIIWQHRKLPFCIPTSCCVIPYIVFAAICGSIRETFSSHRVTNKKPHCVGWSTAANIKDKMDAMPFVPLPVRAWNYDNDNELPGTPYVLAH